MKLFRFLLCATFLPKIYSSGLSIEESDTNGRIHVQSGVNMALTCVHNVLSLEGAVLEWFVPSAPEKPITSGPKAHVYWQNSASSMRLILVIRSVSVNDSGRYTCRIGRRDGDVYHEMGLVKANVVVERRIVSTDCPSEQWIPVVNRSIPEQSTHTSVTIRCSIQALPAPIIHWRFNGTELSTGRIYATSTNGLKIFGPTDADAGVYTVIASQPQNTAVFDIRVSVFSRPLITFGPVVRGPYENALVAGREAYLQCLARGNPPPTIHWYRQRDSQTELTQIDPQRFFANTNNRVGTLRIARVHYPEDSGVYICRAVVSVPYVYDERASDVTDEARTTLNVTIKAKLIPLETMHRFVDEGGTVSVQCRIRATDPLRFYYRKLHTNLTYVTGIQPNDSRIDVRLDLDKEDMLFHNLYFTIKNTTLDDTWNYTCHARNVGGSKKWNTTIRVMQRPQMFDRPSFNPISSGDRAALRFGWRYNATNLTCASRGMPHPIWTWYRRGEQILNDFNDTFRVISWDHWNWSQSWLQVRPCRHTEHFIYDDYVCKATNIKGTNESQVRFMRASVPGQPRLLNYTVTQSSVELNVKPPNHTGGMPITGFELIYSAIGGSSRWYGPVIFPLDASLSRGRPEFRIHGLLGSTGYQFQLSARSIVGSGTYYAFSIRTLDSTRPGPVEIIPYLITTYPYGHVIRWIVPLNGGLPITGYRIRTRRVTLQPDTDPTLNGYWTLDPLIQVADEWHEVQPLYSNPYMNYFHLSDLEPDQVYQVVVEAINMRGHSLDGVDITQYGYINRTPTIHPVVIRSVQTGFASKDLTPIWSVFRTAPADQLGRPQKIFGKASTKLPTLSALFLLMIIQLITSIS